MGFKTSSYVLGNDAAREILIPASSFPIVDINWHSPSISTGDYLGIRSSSSGVQNDEISYDVRLAGGMWTFTLLHFVASTGGIYTVTIDGLSLTSLGGSADTIDGYSAAGAATISRIIGIVLPSTATRRIRLKMASKNVTSTGYFGRISGFSMTRMG